MLDFGSHFLRFNKHVPTRPALSVRRAPAEWWRWALHSVSCESTWRRRRTLSLRAESLLQRRRQRLRFELLHRAAHGRWAERRAAWRLIERGGDCAGLAMSRGGGGGP